MLNPTNQFLKVKEPVRRSSACPDRILRSNQNNPTKEFKAFRYLIIGAGSAATAAVKAIRETDSQGEILLVGDTVHKTLPFHKQPLSGELPTNPQYNPVLDFSDVEREEKDDVLPNIDPQLTHYSHLHAKRIDSDLHRVTLTDGKTFEYDTCLIATGGSPKTPPGLQAVGENCMTYRTLLITSVFLDSKYIRDYNRLKEVCKTVKSVCVIGGGLLGSELASSIATIGIKVTQLSVGPGIYSKLLPRYLTDYITEESHKRGLSVKSGYVVNTEQNANSHTLVLDNGDKIETEFTVICAGTQPNVEIAETAGLPISKEDGGIIVEPTLEVCPDIYAAGDIISWKDPIFKQNRRVDHHDHALHSGEIAGKNMCGQSIEYSHQPFFWSDLGFFAFEAVGLIESKLETVGVWKKERENEAPLVLLSHEAAPVGFKFHTGFVYYLHNNFIVGILLAGMFGKLEQARAMIIQRRISIHKPEDCVNLISFMQ